MPFTLFHLGASYLASIPIRKKVNLLALFIGTSLMDIEGVLTMPSALASCVRAANFAQCTADYPSHLFLHSVPGVLLVVAPIAAALCALRFGKNRWRTFYASAVFGGIVHLAVDTTVHTGADAISWFYPYGQASFYIGAGIWTVIGAVGIFAFLWRERLREWFM